MVLHQRVVMSAKLLTDMLSVELWCLHCHHTGCLETLELKRATLVKRSHEDYEAIRPALDTAAVFLGWRVYQHVYWCPSHTVSKNLVCENCRSLCPKCTCEGGPRGTAVFGGLPVRVLEGDGS